MMSSLSLSTAMQLDSWADRPFLRDTASNSDVRRWVDLVEVKLREMNTPPADWALVGTSILPTNGRLQHAVRNTMNNSGTEKPGLTWTAFTQCLRDETRKFRRTDSTVFNRFCEHHPLFAVSAAAGLVATGSALILPAGLALVGVLGLGITGPVAATGLVSAIHTATIVSTSSIIAGAAAITSGSAIVKTTVDQLEDRE
ncbi:hypothetical protein BJ138DRAFT_1107705 [Hygrophoropsis aurantiaca]|uniref:Uncharacterized protein n=1 Tax=Hygrophoropsis aurantiaca TaxID=72124 RepID=A0ACB7ZRE6_9AGAM|nr:hypothetical protein BJ138DRAFT_1107705 [Hygrophoropsis aurantiaca]